MNLLNASEQTVEIPHASLSIYASSLPQKIEAISHKSDIMSDGFMNRFLFVPSHLPFIRPYSFPNSQHERMIGMVRSLINQRVGLNWRSNGLGIEFTGQGNFYGYYPVDKDDTAVNTAQIRTADGGMQRICIHQPERNFSRIILAPCIQQKMSNLLDAMRDFGLRNQRYDTPDQPEYNGFVRAAKQFTKLAGICALSSWAKAGCQGEPTIGEEEYKLAKCLLSVSSAGMRTLYGVAASSLNSQSARDEFEAIAKCLSIIKREGEKGIDQSILLRKTRLKSDQLNSITQTLQASDQILLKETPPPHGGPKKRTYIAKT